ncbi:MAG TPA: glycoside hydrolase family 38 C-terminal domain-containing protein [Candidatus Limnocylindrales bacterium]|nr:glycoside hydrolase family 38 C-terminal domain-containing protein [Candidatus Limnocylindrales bacterium]
MTDLLPTSVNGHAPHPIAAPEPQTVVVPRHADVTSRDPIAGYHFTIVPHTHWDREWYLPFEVFRLRLARVVETICDVLETDSRFRTFTLDGQAIILEDVVELRPDLEPRLRALLAAGRLSTGPAYVLPDEFLAGPEPLVRNFLIGRAVCARFGAEPMGVGYMPDTFGHVAQLPQILRGFGLDSFIFWRGLGDEANRLGLAFTWEASDGTAVTAVRQLGSYGNASNIGRWAEGGVDLRDRPDRQPAATAARFERFVRSYATELERTGTRELFLCNGSDHEPIQASLPDLLEHARVAHPDTEIEIGSYDDYWRRLAPTLGELPVHRGELVAGRDAPVLRGINSSRMYLKQAAERSERAILVAETLASLATLAGRTTYAYPRAELGRAWRQHVTNMPHDSISGCSVDEVAIDMLPRFTAAIRIAERIRREALASLAGEVEAFGYEPVRSASVSVVNPLAHPRGGAVAIPLPGELAGASSLVAVDGTGTRVAAQIDGSGDETVALVATRIPGFGARTVTLEAGTGAGGPAYAATAVASDGLTNGIVTVVAHPDGSITVTDERSGLVHTGLHRFEDVADRGDEYNFCPVEFDVPLGASPNGTARVVASGPVVAELEVALTLRLPVRLSTDRRRRDGDVAVPVATRIRVTAGSPRVEFTTTIDNRAEDHRLRVLFAAPGGSNDSTIRAEGHFAVVPRPVRPVWTGAAWYEPPALTAHTSGAVAAGDLLVLGRGLPEYETVPTRDGLDVAVTLLRCTGWLSRDDLATRPGGAGPTIATPGAQCLGGSTFEYAIEIAPGLSDGDLLRHSADYRTPFAVGPAGVAPEPLLAVAGDVLVTALKGAEAGEGIVLRAVAADLTDLSIESPFASTRSRIDETPLDGAAAGMLRKGEIRTLRLTRRGGA